MTAPSQPEGGVAPTGTERLHAVIQQLRTHVQALSDGKRAVAAGRAAPKPLPFALLFADLPGILRELEAAEFDIESEFEAYEDRRAPPPAGDNAGLVKRLEARAESYRSGGPSSEHTAAILDEAARAIRRLEALAALEPKGGRQDG